MNKHFGTVILVVGVLILSFCILPNSATALGEPETDVDTPIDGGVGILIAAGVAYGVKKVRDQRKKNIDKTP